jgi:hypothetical protein
MCKSADARLARAIGSLDGRVVERTRRPSLLPDRRRPVGLWGKSSDVCAAAGLRGQWFTVPWPR